MNQSKSRFGRLTGFVPGGTLLAASVGIGPPALAQQSDDSAGVIEEIVVTARLREESAQDIG